MSLEPEVYIREILDREKAFFPPQTRDNGLNRQ